MPEINKTQKKIITAAISLFADKGFYGTSIQEIADSSGISKGAFYLHFKSKDDLLLEIFQYYYATLAKKVELSFDPEKSAIENFSKQLEIQIAEILTHKDFILMYIREQSFSLNKDMLDFIQQKNVEMKRWYEKHLVNIYGERIIPFVPDIATILEGVKASYMQIFMTAPEKLSVSHLTELLINLCDGVAEDFLENDRIPLLNEENLRSILSGLFEDNSDLSTKALTDLQEMGKILDNLRLPSDRVTELQSALDFLTAEVVKPDVKKVIIQGVLANFKGITEFDEYRLRISNVLDIKVL